MDAAECQAWVDGFEAATLEELPHHAHLVVALAYVRRHGAAADRMFEQALLHYLRARNLDVRTYHETITRAWLRLVADFDRHHHDLDLPEAAQRLCERYADKHALDAHYSRERLMSPQAREGWVEPDLDPLPPPGGLIHLRPLP